MSNPISHQPLAGSTISHHVHREDEPLPGARGAAPSVDYTPDTIEHTKLPPSEEGDTQDFTRHTEPRVDFSTTATGPGSDKAAHNTAEPTQGKVKLGDKIVGKTQELAGKVIHNEGLKEKGELRKQGDTI